MSLFEDDRFMYRDTFFVYFLVSDRPPAEAVAQVVKSLGDQYETSNLNSREGHFESLTIRCPQDYSAMDITYVEGDEVREQVKELIGEFKTMTWTGDDREKVALLEKCDARLDVFHFEQVADGEGEEEILDPGGLLLVMERLSEVCGGVGFDPQSQAML